MIVVSGSNDPAHSFNAKRTLNSLGFNVIGEVSIPPAGFSLPESGKKRKHFLGAFVSMPVDMTPAGVSKYVLIDGQQRITTLFLILAAIRDIVIDDRNLSDQINELYLVNKFAEQTNKFKLFPTQADREQFFKIINQETSLNENSNVVKAYHFFKKKLEGKTVRVKI